MKTHKDMAQPHDEEMNTVVDPFLRDTAGLALTIDPQIVVLQPDDVFELRAEQVRKRIGETTVKMLAYNGSIPGPTLKVAQGSEVTVHFSNDTDLESTVHWHGLRLENRFDGVPLHFHGQRFLVLSRNGVPNQNLAWKDTVLVPAGETVDILVEMSNPGAWMVHCHIAEHLEGGMMFTYHVQ
jgi:FtsP/CotA-like multicopper oxidase with cupredoxin domain